MKVIFDIDNTLIKWEDKFTECILMCGDFSDEEKYAIDGAIDSFEKFYYRLTKEDLLRHINSKTGLKLDMPFINKLIKYQGKFTCSRASDEVIDTLEYLASKYTLCIVSNWFEEIQEERLKKAGIYKYFSEFRYSGKYLSKPNADMFLSLKTSKKDVYIGDLDIDRQAARNSGIKYIDIKKIEFRKLKEML